MSQESSLIKLISAIDMSSSELQAQMVDVITTAMTLFPEGAADCLGDETDLQVRREAQKIPRLASKEMQKEYRQAFLKSKISSDREQNQIWNLFKQHSQGNVWQFLQNYRSDLTIETLRRRMALQALIEKASENSLTAVNATINKIDQIQLKSDASSTKQLEVIAAILQLLQKVRKINPRYREECINESQIKYKIARLFYRVPPTTEKMQEDYVDSSVSVEQMLSRATKRLDTSKTFEDADVADKAAISNSLRQSDKPRAFKSARNNKFHNKRKEEQAKDGATSQNKNKWHICTKCAHRGHDEKACYSKREATKEQVKEAIKKCVKDKQEDKRSNSRSENKKAYSSKKTKEGGGSKRNHRNSNHGYESDPEEDE